jgi:hypothetical protein
MRLNAIVRVPFRADLCIVKRKPHPPIHASGPCPVRRSILLALALLVPLGAVPRALAQTTDPATKEKTQKVAAVDPKALRAPSAPDAVMTLRSVSGQEIEAKLISGTGENVTIERIGDGRQFIVPLANLDNYSNERVRQWMDQGPGAVAFNFSVSATKTLLDSNTFMTAGRDLKSAEWSYRVKVTNLTRNVLNGAQLEYRIVFDDEVEIAKTVVAPGKGANQQDGQLVDLPEMQFNDEIEFDTPPLTLHTYEYVPLRGEREYSRDSIKGLWVRIVKNGVVLFEYQSHPATMASLSWDNEDKLEIRVTNQFRDQFATGVK